VLRAVVARTLAVLLVAAAWSPRPVRADAVVGTCTAGSCTEAALDAALGCGAPSGSPPASNCAGGGTVTFNCGASPITITVTSQETIAADTSIDGGGLITLSGGGTTRVSAAIETTIGCHTFRATGITAYLDNGGTLEHAQQIAAHDEALRSHERPDHARRDRANCDISSGR
jgi:hypothetical protein